VGVELEGVAVELEGVAVEVEEVGVELEEVAVELEEVSVELENHAAPVGKSSPFSTASGIRDSSRRPTCSPTSG
jgi:hypothetical protein